MWRPIADSCSEFKSLSKATIGPREYNNNCSANPPTFSEKDIPMLDWAAEHWDEVFYDDEMKKLIEEFIESEHQSKGE